MQEKSRNFRQGRSLSTSSAQCAHWAPSPPRGRLWGQANNHYYTIILKQSRISAALSRLSKNNASCAKDRAAGVHEGVKTRLVIQ